MVTKCRGPVKEYYERLRRFSLAVGSFTLSNPLVRLTSLTLVLAAYLIVELILEFVLAVRLRPVRGSSWLFCRRRNYWSWPYDLVELASQVRVGHQVLVGVSMLFSGVSRLMLSLAGAI